MKKIVACALVISACGTWSNEDLEFIYALPDKATLHAVSPGDSLASSGQGLSRQGLNVGDDSQTAASTKATSAEFNAFLDSILDGLDGIRQIPPTTRTTDTRTWGPYDDSKNPGFQVRVDIERDGGSEYDWQLSYGRVGETFHPFGQGHFKPTITLKEGTGGLFLDAIGARQYLDAGTSTDPDHLTVDYHTDQSPKLVDMFFDKTLDDGGIDTLDYNYRQNDAGEVHADFTATTMDPNIKSLAYDVAWDRSGEGYAKVKILAGNWADAGFEECWDTAQKVVYSDMIFDGGPSPVGLIDACTTIDNF
jgi:hypothetical protein